MKRPPNAGAKWLSNAGGERLPCGVENPKVVHGRQYCSKKKLGELSLEARVLSARLSIRSCRGRGDLTATLPSL
jgi:hypothetical protein